MGECSPESCRPKFRTGLNPDFCKFSDHSPVSSRVANQRNLQAEDTLATLVALKMCTMSRKSWGLEAFRSLNAVSASIPTRILPSTLLQISFFFFNPTHCAHDRHQNREDGSEWALKLIKQSVFAKNKERTEEEVSVLARLNHPNIVKFREGDDNRDALVESGKPDFSKIKPT